MKHIITFSILALITTNSFVSKSNVRRSVSGKVIYKNFGQPAVSTKKEGEGFFNIALPLTSYNDTTH
jgi:hypothetical protein